MIATPTTPSLSLLTLLPPPPPIVSNDRLPGMTGAAAAARVEPINQSRATVAFDPDNGIVHKVD